MTLSNFVKMFNAGKPRMIGLPMVKKYCRKVLPSEIVISVDTTDTFKRRLDKFWQHQDILYDYKVELTGVGNKSPINADDNIVI